MPLTKALAALSAGALLLIGQAGLAQDSYTDETADETEQAQPAVERTQEGQADDPMVVQERDDPYAQDENDPPVADESDAFSTDDDEFSVDAETDVETDEFNSEESEFTVEESTTAEADMYAAMDTQSTGRAFSAIPCACEATNDVAVLELDDTKLSELAHIQAHLNNDIVGITDETTLVERRMEIITRHDWSRQEFNQAVELVNQDQELEARVMTMVDSETELLIAAAAEASAASYESDMTATDESVAGTDTAVDAESDTEFQGEADTEFQTEADTEFQAEADLEDDEDGDWDTDADLTASVESDDEDEEEEDRDW